MKYFSVIVLGGLLLMGGCKKDDPEPVNFEVPSSVTLIFPFENSTCNEGTDVTDTESTILFEWFSSNFTDEYNLHVQNLNSGETATMTTAEVKMPVVLKRATPYAWYVVSKNNNSDSTTQSDTWKFYNAGDGIISYAPFPAEIISPAMAESVSASGNITLSWQGADVDDDIAGYDIYFGTDTEPSLLAENQPAMTHSVSVTSGSIYYWRIVTRDESGHESDSGVFQFRVL